ncbi:MAG TPA: class I SAM-dependent methyltransferase [Polyangiaceae bacterium]|nr:class I SAM-dependent methyltransferase [Polyangiaceae bacterium]
MTQRDATIERSAAAGASRPGRRARGDWQTPLELARAVLALAVDGARPAPASVVEPTCGRGAFLVAARERLPEATLVGYDLDRGHLDAARQALGGGARLRQGDFFTRDWRRTLARLPEPILVTGNPPWVTSSVLGALGAGNLPVKHTRGLSLGRLGALTGRSDFDISEWMLLRLLEALSGRTGTLAVLCKSQVARRVLASGVEERLGARPGGLFRLDARRHFGASVDAVLFVCHFARGPREPARAGEWPVRGALDASAPEAWLGLHDGALVPDTRRLRGTLHLEGLSSPEWRSGLKHDCAAVMELTRGPRGWENGLGELVDLEPSVLFPLLKGADLARSGPERAVVVPQRALGDDTARLRDVAPRAWAYLTSHRARLDARRSAIYAGRPPFAIFGVGPYAFAPWKVAVSGLHKRLLVALLGPRGEGAAPVMLDDTCYYLPFEGEAEAARARDALESPLAADFVSARVFWDAKRPIQKAVLQRLDLEALAQARDCRQ